MKGKFKNLKKYAVAVGILAAGCAALKNYNPNLEKNNEIRQIPIIQTIQPKIVKNNSIEDMLEEKYGIELTKEINGHQLPANDMYITTFSLPNGRGAFHCRPVDPYYCAIRADYVNLNKKMGCEYDGIARKWWKDNIFHKRLYDSEASKFWKNKIFLVYNPNFKDPKTKKIEGRAIICRDQDWGPGKSVVRHAKKQVIDASHKTAKYLIGRGGSGWSDRNQVYTYLIKDQNLKTGPIYYKK